MYWLYREVYIKGHQIKPVHSLLYSESFITIIVDYIYSQVVGPIAFDDRPHSPLLSVLSDNHYAYINFWDCT